MRGGARQGAGRPEGTSRPSGKKMRSLRLTDREYEEVKKCVKNLREERLMNNWYARLTEGTTPKYFANEAEVKAYYMLRPICRER